MNLHALHLFPLITAFKSTAEDLITISNILQHDINRIRLLSFSRDLSVQLDTLNKELQTKLLSEEIEHTLLPLFQEEDYEDVSSLAKIKPSKTTHLRKT